MRERIQVGGRAATRFGSRKGWITALGVALALTVMPRQDARAGDEDTTIGQRWLACREKALSAEGACFSRASGYWDEQFCGIAWEMDLIGCDMQAYREIRGQAT